MRTTDYEATPEEGKGVPNNEARGIHSIQLYTDRAHQVSGKFYWAADLLPQ